MYRDLENYCQESDQSRIHWNIICVLAMLLSFRSMIFKVDNDLMF